MRSVSNARNARESQVYRGQFLASIKDRLGTDAVKRKALDLCQELFLADGARSDEEDAVLQNLRTLLEYKWLFLCCATEAKPNKLSTTGPLVRRSTDSPW